MNTVSYVVCNSNNREAEPNNMHFTQKIHEHTVKMLLTFSCLELKYKIAIHAYMKNSVITHIDKRQIPAVHVNSNSKRMMFSCDLEFSALRHILCQKKF